jgi:GT2 family glycosyltransferase
VELPGRESQPALPASPSTALPASPSTALPDSPSTSLPAPLRASLPLTVQSPAPAAVPGGKAAALPGRPVVVVLGMLTKMPVAGVAWQTLHYLAGFERLGYDAYYVEAHGRTPSMLMQSEHDDGPALAAAYLDRVMRRFGFADRWAYQAVHSDERVLGMSATALAALFARADLIVNLHGGTEPLPEHSATGRLIYLETDPVQLQVELHDGLAATRAFLDPHVAFFTFGENLGRAGCGLPQPVGYDFRPTRQPVVLEHWPVRPSADGAFTTVGNWRQAWREVQLDGEVYGWSKHTQFDALLDLPARCPQATVELALSSCTADEQEALRRRGFTVRDALSLSRELDPYRAYVTGSRAELTAAKDQNVRLRSGWFSDRSATYLASGRPVITQDTGFGRVLPTGIGLHAWRTLDDAAAAVEAVLADPLAQSRAAREIAEECFDSDKVLGRILDALGLPVRSRGGSSAADPGRRDASAPGPAAAPSLPDDLPLQAVSRRPLVLPESTRATARELSYPRPVPGADLGAPDRPVDMSVVIVCHNGLELTRLCLASLLGDASAPSFEVLVVDNASSDGTSQDLAALAASDGRVRLLPQSANLGFAAGVNAGLGQARGALLVLLNNDTVVPPGTLAGLARHLLDPEVGAVGPVTNRCGNEAEIAPTWTTYGELVAAAQDRARSHAGQVFDLPVLTMFCTAFRRDVLDRVGPLDERFGIGMFEDDDWAERLRACGLRLVVAEDVLVHHHGEGSLGALVATGAHAELFARNRAAFEAKWARTWEPHTHRPEAGYLREVRALCDAVRSELPESARPLVVSKGDSALLRCGRSAGHFPQDGSGHFPGHYPGDSASVVDQLEALCDRGFTHLVLPATAAWWLDHYAGLASYLDGTAERVVDEPSGVAFRLRVRQPAEVSA